ncbi:hypothetical protein AURDEDRAFT_160819 [Auricularia subglabra TFB-10046 SS5]|nr:hypothetical protein AURDEDRAFT_160819 [Auricularia subglabra TFB-10046 SS5]
MVNVPRRSPRRKAATPPPTQASPRRTRVTRKAQKIQMTQDHLAQDAAVSDTAHSRSLQPGSRYLSAPQDPMHGEIGVVGLLQYALARAEALEWIRNSPTPQHLDDGSISRDDQRLCAHCVPPNANDPAPIDDQVHGSCCRSTPPLLRVNENSHLGHNPMTKRTGVEDNWTGTTPVDRSHAAFARRVLWEDGSQGYYHAIRFILNNFPLLDLKDAWIWFEYIKRAHKRGTPLNSRIMDAFRTHNWSRLIHDKDYAPDDPVRLDLFPSFQRVSLAYSHIIVPAAYSRN